MLVILDCLIISAAVVVMLEGASTLMRERDTKRVTQRRAIRASLRTNVDNL
jgi:hypothetical protein